MIYWRDTATPSSSSYHEQSYSEATIANTAWPRFLLSISEGMAILILKLAWNVVLYLMSGCKVTRKQVS